MGNMKLHRLGLVLVLAGALWAQAPPNPVLDTSHPQQVSAHVWAIVGWPNIAIVTGPRATLVVDTGLGPANGRAVAQAARRLSNPRARLYLTTTHFHPEHASGDSGFPADTILIRNTVQQKELEAHGMDMVHMFASRSAQNRELLAGVAFRTPDILFDRAARLDLGDGVSARLFWMGTAHTLGDELIEVEPDRTLIPGDIVQNKLLPNLYGTDANLKSWIEILGQLRALNALHVVPDHGALGSGALVDQEYLFLTRLQTRALALKRQGESADEAGRTVLKKFQVAYPDWPNLQGIPGLVAHVYSENP